MTVNKTTGYLVSLVHELCGNPKEIEWIEFKHNNADPDEIGQQISALANAAALCGKASGYLVWGIEDKTHNIIGTSFSSTAAKVGNEELENWLLRLLEPKTHLRFSEFKINNFPVVLLEITRAPHHPVRFKGDEFIKIGSYTKRLKDFPEIERKLWQIFDGKTFEEEVAADNLASDEVLRLLDYPTYFERLNLPLPDNRDRILEALENDAMISRSEISKWNVLNLGAILFARKLSDFKSLKRKTIRVIVYRKNDRTETIKEHEEISGYANGFENLINYINNVLPANEIIEQALRKNVTMYPELAVRELVANAIIHQDFFISGTAPMIEIFKDRIEITNPGTSLIETSRLLDSPPRSRNEALASFMRRIGICEERGSGVDKVVQETEKYQLPAPVFEIAGENTRVVLFSHQPMNRMDKKDRIRACYLHACLKYVTRDYMTNSSLRERFGIDPKNSAVASRIIKDALEAGLIHPYDTEASKKFIKYIPSWAK